MYVVVTPDVSHLLAYYASRGRPIHVKFNCTLDRRVPVFRRAITGSFGDTPATRDGYQEDKREQVQWHAATGIVIRG